MSDESQNSTPAAESVVVFDSPLVNKMAKFKKEIIGAAVLVIAAFIILAVVISSQQSKDTATWKQIFVATATTQPGSNEFEEKLNTVIKDNSGANALFYAYMVTLKELGSLLDRDKLIMAKTAAENFLSAYPSHPFAAQVRVDYASVLCKLQKFDDAIAQYKNVSATGPEYLKGQALFFLGLAQEKAGKTKEALDTYAEVASGEGRYLAEIVDMASFARAALEQKMMQPATPAEPAKSTETKEEPKTDKPAEKAAEKTEAETAPKAEESK